MDTLHNCNHNGVLNRRPFITSHNINNGMQHCEIDLDSADSGRGLSEDDPTQFGLIHSSLSTLTTTPTSLTGGLGKYSSLKQPILNLPNHELNFIKQQNQTGTLKMAYPLGKSNVFLNEENLKFSKNEDVTREETINTVGKKKWQASIHLGRRIKL